MTPDNFDLYHKRFLGGIVLILGILAAASLILLCWRMA